MAHETFDLEIVWSILFGLAASFLIPIYAYFLLRNRFSVYDSGAIAAAYGSISAVTFVTATSYLEAHALTLHGHMVAVMALMEAPAIISGLLLINFFAGNGYEQFSKRKAVCHSLTNGSVFLIIGSLVIGLLASEEQAQGIKPFTTDIFKGFLAIFLLDMGIESGRNLKSLFSFGWFPILFSILIPLFNGCLFAWLSGYVTPDISNRFIFAILTASASYIAVPAAMKVSVPQANPGLYLPMALAITFPINITIGMPLYYAIVNQT